MAKINSSTLRNWNDGEVMYSQDYEQERSIIQTAINDNFDRLIKNYSVLDESGVVKTTQTLDTAINDLKFKDTSTIILSLDNTTSTLQIAVIDGSITTSKLQDLGVTTSKIADGNVTTVKLANLSVTNEKLATSSVTTSKIWDNAITDEKIGSRAISDNGSTHTKQLASHLEQLYSLIRSVKGTMYATSLTPKSLTNLNNELSMHSTSSEISHPDQSVTTRKLRDESVTDVKVGVRTVLGYQGYLTSLLEKIAEQIANLSGNSLYSWSYPPASNVLELKQRLDELDNVYSTDSERIAAINDVINQFEIADDDLEVLINNKANKSDVYTKIETYTQTQTRSLVYDSGTEARVLYQGGTHITITHNLNDYPSVNVVAKNGFGHYGYGSGEYGSSGNFNIPASVDYPNENQVVVSLIENYLGDHSVSLSGNVARVTFPSEDGIYLDVYLRGNS